MRDLSNELSLLNLWIGHHLDLRPIDLDVLDLISREGPLPPGALARASGVHPATLTGVLDRLERSGWIERVRDPAATDRRTVQVRALSERVPELYRLYAGMTDQIQEICADYSVGELELLADFLGRAAEGGRAAAARLRD